MIVCCVGMGWDGTIQNFRKSVAICDIAIITISPTVIVLGRNICHRIVGRCCELVDTGVGTFLAKRFGREESERKAIKCIISICVLPTIEGFSGIIQLFK